jgi:hypothetical protein
MMKAVGADSVAYTRKDRIIAVLDEAFSQQVEV